MSQPFPPFKESRLQHYGRTVVWPWFIAHRRQVVFIAVVWVLLMVIALMIADELDSTMFGIVGNVMAGAFGVAYVSIFFAHRYKKRESNYRLDKRAYELNEQIQKLYDTSFRGRASNASGNAGICNDGHLVIEGEVVD